MMISETGMKDVNGCSVSKSRDQRAGDQRGGIVILLINCTPYPAHHFPTPPPHTQLASQADPVPSPTADSPV